VLRRKSGFTTYITPPTPVGVPLDTLYPQQAEEQTPVEFPVDVHFIDALVDVRVQRVSDGRVIAAWRQELGAYRVARPAPAPAAAGPSSQPVEQVAHAWTAVVGDAGADLARWIEAPQVEVTRPLWLMRVGPPSAVAATRRAIDLADHGDWRAAEAAFREALAAAPRDPRSHANLAVALERRGDRAGAWAELKAAVALERPGEVRCANVLHEFTRTFLPAAPPEVLLRQSTSAPSRAPAIAPSP
jgi:tetratricopeptide (TPR) repeat protein